MVNRRIVLGLIAILTCGGAVHGGLTLARDGKTDYVIVLAGDAIPAERTAAEELASHLKRVTGAEFEIRESKDTGARDAVIVVGGKVPEGVSAGKDGIVVRTEGRRRLVLTGDRPRGALYAVYTFLEDVVGCRWWTSTEETIPNRPTLEVEDVNVVYTPKLRYREAYNWDVMGPRYVQATRLKVNGHHMGQPEAWGGHYTLIGWCHTAYSLIPPAMYWSKHPDWFAEREGKRSPNYGQLCWSNQDMLKEMAKEALRRIRKNPAAGIISISQNDGWGECQCEKCKAIDTAEGSPSGSLLTGVNFVADEIHKEYPDFLVETLAYVYSRKPPKTVRPAPNVLIRLCSIEGDFAHPLAQQDFGEDLRKWKKIAPQLFVWNYTTNFSNYLIPHPNLRSLGADLNFFADNKVLGVFEQGDAYNRNAGDFLPLRVWLTAHVMWNPEADQSKLTAEFLNGYYGAAGPHLQKYLDLVNARSDDPKFRMGCYHKDANFLSRQDLAKAVEYFDAAAKAVAADAVLSQRVARERLPVDLLRVLRFEDVAEIRTRDPEGAAKRHAKDVEAYIAMAQNSGVTMHGEPLGFSAYVPNLRSKSLELIPLKLPKAGEPVPAGTYVIEQDQFFLYRKGTASALVDDPKAADGKAARMPGGTTEWAVQFHVPEKEEFVGKGPWRCFVMVRAGKKAGSAGHTFTVGLYDPKAGVVAMNEIGSSGFSGEYRAYPIVVPELKVGEYFWVAPSGNGNAVDAVYVDRIVIQKAR